MEFKIYTARIRSIDRIIKALKTDNIGFKLKIQIGDNFTTNSQTVICKRKKGVLICEFYQAFRVYFDPTQLSQATLFLCAYALGNNKLSDEFQSLQNDYVFGSSTISLDKIQDQKHPMWVPLNNGICFENPSLPQDGTMLSLNFKLIEGLPGNYPETAMSGKSMTIGGIVYYRETVTLNYPINQVKFNSLRRKDVQFDNTRVGTIGCPLRLPTNEDEWKCSGLDSNINLIILLEKDFTVDNDELTCFGFAPCKVPFIFKLPNTKEEFIEKKLPGDYTSLLTKYQAEGVVDELDIYDEKRLGILHAIDDNDICYITPMCADPTKRDMVKVK